MLGDCCNASVIVVDLTEDCKDRVLSASSGHWMIVSQQLNSKPLRSHDSCPSFGSSSHLVQHRICAVGYTKSECGPRTRERGSWTSHIREQEMIFSLSVHSSFLQFGHASAHAMQEARLDKLWGMSSCEPAIFFQLEMPLERLRCQEPSEVSL